MPLISVIIPAYNAEKTIKRTIESVLNQTFQDFELLIIDDDSQDSTLEIVSRISDPRIKVFSCSHAGASSARNYGFSQSVGEFIAFLDADDLWTPDKLESQLKALQATPKAAVAYSWTDMIDESDQFICPCSHLTANGNIYAKLLLTCFVVSGSNTLIRRQAFIKINGFDESLVASQDFDLYLRLAAQHEYVAVPYPNVLYRISSNSMSTNIRRLEATSLLVREKAFNQSPEPLPPCLKHHSIANFYKGILFRMLNDPPSQKRGLESSWFLWNIIRYDPVLLRKKIFIKMLVKTTIFLLLPPRIAKLVLGRLKSLSNIKPLVQSIKVDPDNLA